MCLTWTDTLCCQRFQSEKILPHFAGLEIFHQLKQNWANINDVTFVTKLYKG